MLNTRNKFANALLPPKAKDAIIKLVFSPKTNSLRFFF